MDATNIFKERANISVVEEALGTLTSILQHYNDDDLVPEGLYLSADEWNNKQKKMLYHNFILHKNEAETQLHRTVRSLESTVKRMNELCQVIEQFYPAEELVGQSKEISKAVLNDMGLEEAGLAAEEKLLLEEQLEKEISEKLKDMRRAEREEKNVQGTGDSPVPEKKIRKKHKVLKRKSCPLITTKAVAATQTDGGGMDLS